MSLRAFHILFIAVSSLTVLATAAWAVKASDLPMGLAATIFGVGLVIYGIWFARKIRPLATTVVLWFAATRNASACSVCFGAAEGPMIDAARLGVWLLFGLVLLVQLAFVAFFLHLRRQAKIS